jgi:anti-sigma regulatory factor (Ser/Thr protein kinase)
MHYEIVDFVIDIVQNSCEAGASLVELRIEEDGTGIGFEVRDNGKGMDALEQAKAIDPFVTDGIKHPGRKVGLGLPFLKQALEQSGGSFRLESEKGRGARLSFRFDKGNLDCPPIGDLAGMMVTVLCMPGPGELLIRRTREGYSYSLRKSELTEALGNLEEVSSLVLLKEYVRSQEKEGEELWQG